MICNVCHSSGVIRHTVCAHWADGSSRSPRYAGGTWSSLARVQFSFMYLPQKQRLKRVYISVSPPLYDICQAKEREKCIGQWAGFLKKAQWGNSHILIHINGVAHSVCFEVLPPSLLPHQGTPPSLHPYSTHTYTPHHTTHKHLSGVQTISYCSCVVLLWI